ncbi:DUF2231 domain-containing protein [Nocardia sp. NPDC088792]|uniref:DUF2231 domain-containing protein n=1 Tax=Nocardia sp. NPDC088792 TaxID=3364332 RepID=UPI00380CDBDA
MSTFNGLPAHVLLVHFIVVLVPLTAVLLILCAVWPAARVRLIWPTALLAVGMLILTPLTTNAGEWFRDHVGNTPAIQHHQHLGDQLVYFVVALVIAAAVLVFVHVRGNRGKPIGRALLTVIAILVVVAGGAATWQTYRVGDSGAHAVWGGTVS